MKKTSLALTGFLTALVLNVLPEAALASCGTFAPEESTSLRNALTTGQRDTEGNVAEARKIYEEISRNQIDAIKLGISKGTFNCEANMNSIADYQGNDFHWGSPLFIAIAQGKTDIATALIDAGANLTRTAFTEKFSGHNAPINPLGLAIYLNNYKVAEAILKKNPGAQIYAEDLGSTSRDAFLQDPLLPFLNGVFEEDSHQYSITQDYLKTFSVIVHSRNQTKTPYSPEETDSMLGHIPMETLVQLFGTRGSSNETIESALGSVYSSDPETNHFRIFTDLENRKILDQAEPQPYPLAKRADFLKNEIEKGNVVAFEAFQYLADHYPDSITEQEWDLISENDSDALNEQVLRKWITQTKSSDKLKSRVLSRYLTSLASRQRQGSAMKRLIAEGIRPSASDQGSVLFSAFGESYYAANDVRAAPVSFNFELFNNLLRMHPDLNAVNLAGNTVLIQLVRFIEAQCSSEQADDHSQKKDRQKVIQLARQLIAAGANPDIKNKDGKRAISYARITTWGFNLWMLR